MDLPRYWLSALQIDIRYALYILSVLYMYCFALWETCRLTLAEVTIT